MSVIIYNHNYIHDIGGHDILFWFESVAMINTVIRSNTLRSQQIIFKKI